MDFVKDDGRCVIVAMDHGAAMGAIEGLEDVESAIKKASKADGLLLTYGTAKRFNSFLKEQKIPFILRCDHFTSLLSIKPPEIEGYSITADIDEAQKLGASAVMLYLVFGMNSTEAFVKNVEAVAGFAEACSEAGLPLYVESVLWGKNFAKEEQNDVKFVKHACRIAAELGADIIKAPYTGSRESFEEVVKGCYVPITVLGEAKGETNEVLKNVRDAMDAGAIGVVFGRNVWQSKEPEKMLGAISRLVHENAQVNDVVRELE